VSYRKFGIESIDGDISRLLRAGIQIGLNDTIPENEMMHSFDFAQS